MSFELERHQRRSIRLRGYDYSAAGAYFLTICARDRVCLFGDVVGDEMRPNEFGGIVAMCWEAIPRHFETVALDAWVLMPNHLHGIIVIHPVGVTHAQVVGATHASPLVRPRGRLISKVEVRVGVSHSSEAEGNCVRREAGVESNRRRTVGPQDDEPVSAVCRGEPARGR